MSVRVEQTLLSVQSDFQHIEIVDTQAFGKMMFLDGHIQLTELDEHVYHEALVHVPMLNLSEPKKALVIGGGDGGVLRELVKFRSLERIDMVEIDAAVIEASRSIWPELSDGAFEDPRVNLTIGDAFPFVQQSDQSYDLIVADSTDVYEEDDESLSERLFTDGFYRDCHRLLSNQGLLVTQADNLVFCPYSLEGILELFSPIFPVVGSFFAVIPSFGGYSGYAYASKSTHLKRLYNDLNVPTAPARYLHPIAYDYGMSELPFESVT